MAVVPIKGLKKVTRRLATGKVATYWYAWAGGPRLEGTPGSPAFLAAYQSAVAERRTPSRDVLSALVVKYRGSPEYAGLADSTKREWSRWLDRISNEAGDFAIGGFAISAFDDRKVKADILDWRDQWGHASRAADYAMQVLSRVLAYGVERGELAMNAADGISKLYASDRADIVWTLEEVADYERRAPSPEVGFIVPLATMTGLRREDLARLEWSNVGDVAIIVVTGKGQGSRTAIIPLLRETKELLARIKAHRGDTTTVLTNTRGVAWTPSGLTHAVKAVGIPKRLHDARGTLATRLRLAGRKGSEIADVMGWSETKVERILRIYVDRNAIVLDIARTLNGK